MDSTLIELAKEITQKSDPEEALSTILADYISNKIQECEKVVKKFEKKYNMSFEEFERKLGNEISLSYEHELDYGLWGAHLDELKALKEKGNLV